MFYKVTDIFIQNRAACIASTSRGWATNLWIWKGKNIT